MRERKAQQHAAEQRAAHPPPAGERAAPSLSGTPAVTTEAACGRVATASRGGRRARPRARTLALAALQLVFSCVLSACTPAPAEPALTPAAAQSTGEPAAPIPSPSPACPKELFSPVVSDPPENESEALTNAQVLLPAYFRALACFRTSPEETEVIYTYGQGPQVETDIKGAREVAAAGYTYSGVPAFIPDMNQAYVQSWRDGSSGTEVEVPYGQVTIPGCYDLTAVKMTAPDGSPASTIGVARAHMIATIFYDPVTRQWMLFDLNLPEGKATEC